MDVVVDTNIILRPFTDGLALIDELERLLGAVRPILAQPVSVELGSLALGNDATARAAKGALRISRAWQTEATPLPGDDGILDVARRMQAAVATNDKKLQAEAVKAGLTVVAPRGKGRLGVVGR
jgi:rRNA-processing protein FCF1